MHRTPARLTVTSVEDTCCRYTNSQCIISALLCCDEFHTSNSYSTVTCCILCGAGRCDCHQWLTARLMKALHTGVRHCDTKPVTAVTVCSSRLQQWIRASRLLRERVQHHSSALLVRVRATAVP
eukprot:16108-Heterococcus_DN1.PRE.2